jgi:RNA polymerase sigma-70 factor (ECF subfamily)
MSARPTYESRVTAAEVEWVHRQLRRLGVPTTDLEDAVQDVLMHAYRRWADYDPSRPIRAWLFGFSVRVASDHRRRRRRRDPLRDEHGPDAVAGSVHLEPDSRLATSRARDLVTRALAELPLERRAIVVLVDLEEHSVPEACEALEVPLNTAYSRLRTGRAELTAAIRRLAAGEAP